MSEEDSFEEQQNLDNDSKTVVIGSGVKIDGRIDSALDTHVSGNYTGTMNSENLNISRSGVVKGDIRVDDATVDGLLEGDIKVKNHLIINQNGNVNGTIEYNTIEIKFGGKISGTLRHAGAISSFNQNSNNSNLEQNSSTEE